MTLGTLILPGHYKFIYFDVFEFTLVGRIRYERKNLDISYSTNQDILTKNDCNNSSSSTFSVSTHPFAPIRKFWKVDESFFISVLLLSDPTGSICSRKTCSKCSHILDVTGTLSAISTCNMIHVVVK